MTHQSKSRNRSLLDLLGATLSLGLVLGLIALITAGTGRLFSAVGWFGQLLFSLAVQSWPG